MAVTLSQETFADFIAQSSRPVLVDFFKEGCIPCRRVAPLVSKAEGEYAQRLTVARVNFGANPSLAAQYRIEAAPTLVLFKDGAETARQRGAVDRNAFRTWLEANL